MENTNHAELHSAITYGKHPDVYPIRLGGLDTIELLVEGNVQERLLRSTLNDAMGSRTITLKLYDGDRIRLKRQLYGLGAVGIGGIKTFDIRTYKVSQGSLVQAMEDKEGVALDAVNSRQYQAYIYFLNAVIGGGNVVTWYDNSNVDAIRFTNTFSLNEESMNTGMVYKITSPRNAAVLSSYEIMETRKQLGDGKTEIPEGTVYLKVPLKGRELKFCGNPRDIEKYLGGLSKCEDFKLHKLDEAYYAILPNIQL